MVAAALELWKQHPRMPLRDIAAELRRQGYSTPNGRPYAAQSIANMLAKGTPSKRAAKVSSQARLPRRRTFAVG
jgi:hypothetical protein